MSKNGDKYGPKKITTELTLTEVPRGEGILLSTFQERVLARLQKSAPKGAVLLPETLRIYQTDGYHQVVRVSIERERTQEEMDALKIEAIALIRKTAAAVGLDVTDLTIPNGGKGKK